MRRSREPLSNLLRSAACAPAVLAMPTYWRVRSAPATHNLPSLATVLQGFPEWGVTDMQATDMAMRWQS